MADSVDYLSVERLASLAPPFFESRGQWESRVTPDGKSALSSWRLGEAIALRVSGAWVDLVFFAHTGGGSVLILIEGVSERVISLFAEVPESRIVRFDNPMPGAPVDIMISVDNRNVDARRCASEVWLLGFRASESQPWEQPSQQLAQHVRMLHASWGRFLVLNTDIGLPPTIVQKGVWADDDVRLFRRLLRRGMTVLDVGANFGHHTVVFSRLVGDSGRVLAFEPQRVMFELLCGNLVLNAASNVFPMRVAIAESAGLLRLWPIAYDAPVNFGALGIDTSDNAVERSTGELVEVSTLDRIMEHSDLAGRRVDFVKIDVQTYELFVLRGGSKLLARDRPLIFAEVSPYWMRKHPGYDYRLIYELLHAAGYRIAHSPTVSRLVGTDGIPVWDGVTDVDWDLLAIPAEAPAEYFSLS